MLSNRGLERWPMLGESDVRGGCTLVSHTEQLHSKICTIVGSNYLPLSLDSSIESSMVELPSSNLYGYIQFKSIQMFECYSMGTQLGSVHNVIWRSI